MRIFTADKKTAEEENIEVGKIYYQDGAYIFGPFDSEAEAQQSYNNGCPTCEG
jgi:hypothetical protein